MHGCSAIDDGSQELSLSSDYLESLHLSNLFDAFTDMELVVSGNVVLNCVRMDLVGYLDD